MGSKGNIVGRLIKINKRIGDAKLDFSGNNRDGYPIPTR